AVGRWRVMVNCGGGGGCYARGGTQAFADAIAAKFVASGGDLLVSTAVRDVLVDGTRAAGVRLADGREIAADAVVSNVDPAQTFFPLLDRTVWAAYPQRPRAL